MTEKIMQCCYTNAVKEAGGKTSSGWQAVLISEDLPSEAYTTCVNLQSANSMIQSHMVDGQGNALNLFELIGDGAYVYVIRTQYGLTDRLGRPNMFSHAYIFSWKQEDVIRDPNVFLTLTKDCFAKDEESARRPRDKLDRSEPFTLDRALDRAGMTVETYRTLLQCVYAQYGERKASKPVYVQYDGTEEQMQAILYCIYYGLPYYVRRGLSVASAATGATRNRNLIFSVDAVGSDCFVAPQTGENNVLTPRVKRKIERYGFVGYAAQHYSEINVNHYFQELEQSAMELGDPTASDELILKIAHQLREAPALTELADADLDSCLSDALRSRSHGSPRMEEYISGMLDEVRRRGMSLTEESEANLNQRLESSVTTRLYDAAERYNISRFSALPAGDAAKRLRGLTRPMFDRYRQALLERDNGPEILDCFYGAYGLEGKERTWETLHELLDKVEDIPNAIKTREYIDVEAGQLYLGQLEEPGQAQSAYRALMELMRRLHGEDQLVRCGAAAKEAYWDKQTFESFSLDRLDEYQSMRANTRQCELFEAFHGVLEAYRLSGENKFLEALSSFAAEYEPVFGPPRRPQPFQEKLETELRTISPRTEVLSGWIDVASQPTAKDAIKDILELRSQLFHGEFDKLVDTYQKIAQENCSYTGSNTLIQVLSETLEKKCLETDQPGKPVPLDVWLALGRSLYPSNAFHIFDNIDACVIRLEDVRAADQSKLFDTHPFSDQAEEYVQSKGKGAKTVRKWIQARKHRLAGERRERKEADIPMLGRNLVSHFFSPRGARESRPDRRAPGRSIRGEAAVQGSQPPPEPLDQEPEKWRRTTPEGPESGERLPKGAALEEKTPEEGKITRGTETSIL